MQVLTLHLRRKMVRVLARVPFDIRSEQGNGVSNSSSSRSDRSTSANANFPNDRSTEYFDEQGASRRSSSKLSPSASRSASMSSVHQASTSHFSASDDVLEGAADHKLKVHLIPSSKSNMRILGGRGRSSSKYRKLGGDLDDRAALSVLEGIQSVDSERDLIRPNHPDERKEGEAGPTLSLHVETDKTEIGRLDDGENADVRRKLHLYVLQ